MSKPRPFVFQLDDVLAALPLHGMPPTERSILRAIATHAGPDGTGAFPSLERVSRLTGHGISTVVKAIKVLASDGRRWLSKVARRDEKTGAATSNGYTVHLDGAPWGDEQATKRKRKPPERAPLSIRRTPPTNFHPTDTPSSPDGIAPLHPTDTPSSPDAQDPFFNPPREPSINPPSRPRARAGAQQSLLPDLDGATATGTPLPASGVREKPAKPPREKTAGERYADAFVQAFTDRGRTVSRPTTNEVTLLGKLCRDHARDRAGVVLVGDALPVWIRAQVGAMVDGVDDPTRHRGGLSVLGLRHWLDTVGPVRVRELDPPAPPRAAPEAPRALNRPPSNVTLEEAIAAIRANPYFPQPERTIAGLQAKIALRDAAKAEGQAANG